MKSAKLIYACSIISGIILFFTGIFFLVDSNKATPSGNNSQNIANHSNNSYVDKYESYTSKDSLNFLVLIKEASGLNTDTIIIANYNPESKQLSLLTVPRDTKPSSTSPFKINSYYAMGYNKSINSKGLTSTEAKHKAVEYSAQAISNITNISINYYVYLEIDTVKEIVDRLGGVYFDIPADLKYSDPRQKLYVDLKKGYQLLDGDNTEQFLRFRYSNSRASSEWKKYYDGSDLKRTEMQIKFVNELIKQKVNILELPKLIPIINYGFENVITNFSLSDALSLVTAFTESTKPSINTYKLYGANKRFNGTDYFIYTKQIENTKTREVIDSEEIINEFFIIDTDFINPDKDKVYDYVPILKGNPSNSDTDSEGDNKDKP